MLRFLAPLVLLSTTRAIEQHSYSAASPAQIKFAIENKYDDTGPGAKKPDYAYNTYKRLDDALVGYIDDPDTKLPEYEKYKAIRKLYGSEGLNFFNTEPEFQTSKYEFRSKVIHDRPKVSFIKHYSGPLKHVQAYNTEPFRWHREHLVKANPLSVAHYNKDPDNHIANQQHIYSYERRAADGRSSLTLPAPAASAGGVVGYFSYRDAAGRQRTEHYHSAPPAGYQHRPRPTPRS